MSKRDDVLLALELCRYDPDPGQTLKHIHSCRRCPYYHDGILPRCAMLYTDAIELIKGQDENHQMSLVNTEALTRALKKKAEESISSGKNRAYTKGLRDAIVMVSSMSESGVPVTPAKGGVPILGTWWYQCGACNAPINPKQKYCGECGRKMDWEGIEI